MLGIRTVMIVEVMNCLWGLFVRNVEPEDIIEYVAKNVKRIGL